MPTIIITGGAGFIGSHTCEQFVEHNKVICIDNFNCFYNPAIKRNNISKLLHYPNFTLCEGDICDIPFLEQVFSSYLPTAVIHLAAYAGVRPSIENPTLYTQANINGTLAVLECMKKYQVKNLLFASSSSVYGNSTKTPFSENDSVDSPISPYAATKKAGELLAHTYHHLYNINVACLRFFTVYGPRQRPDLAIYKFTKKIFKNEVIPFYGDGSTRRDYTFIDDILNGILKAYEWVTKEDCCFDVFNLGESHTVSLTELVENIEKATGKVALLQPLPPQPGDVSITYADITKATTLLGYKPTTSIEQGILQFVKWYQTTIEDDFFI